MSSSKTTALAGWREGGDEAGDLRLCGSNLRGSGCRAVRRARSDIPMLQFTKHADKPTLRLLILHDDNEREFDYTSGAEQALEQAGKDGWTVVSVKNDWATVF